MGSAEDKSQQRRETLERGLASAAKPERRGSQQRAHGEQRRILNSLFYWPTGPWNLCPAALQPRGLLGDQGLGLFEYKRKWEDEDAKES